MKNISIEIQQHKKIFKLPFEIFWRKYNSIKLLENALKLKYNAEQICFYDSAGFGGIII